MPKNYFIGKTPFEIDDEYDLFTCRVFCENNKLIARISSRVIGRIGLIGDFSILYIEITNEDIYEMTGENINWGNCEYYDISVDDIIYRELNNSAKSARFKK